VRQAERGNHQQNGGPRKQRLGRRPEQLAGHHVGQAERRIENRIPGFLHMHPRKRRIKRLESRRIHRRSANGAGGEKGDVRLAFDRRQHRPQAVTEAEHVDQRISQIAENGRQGQLLPDQKIAPPDGEPANRESGGRHGGSSR
jgi:hypothetical protein